MKSILPFSVTRKRTIIDTWNFIGMFKLVLTNYYRLYKYFQTFFELFIGINNCFILWKFNTKFLLRCGNNI